MMIKKPSYYFEFCFEAEGDKAHLIDLACISKKLKIKPSSTKMKGERFVVSDQTGISRFSRWNKQSKTYQDYDIEANFEKFVNKFQKREKQILEILDKYQEHGLSAGICFVPTFYGENVYDCSISPEMAACLSRMRLSFGSYPQVYKRASAIGR